jgi:citrate/tricarballylate utilization protein
MPTDNPHATAALAEADRLMVVCNSCRYCEGLCAVFPAMELRRSFADGDLDYLANLCHSCGACYDDCQFSPPHEFEVNVPKVLAQVRNESYARHAWPPVSAKLFSNNGRVTTAVAGFALVAMTVAMLLLNPSARLFAAVSGAGAFYRLMSHNLMTLIFGGAFSFVLLALAMGLRAFWRDIGEPPSTLVAPASLWAALKDAGSLRYLDGGGAGCATGAPEIRDHRRLFHHLTFYGFMLCFASTISATAYHYGLHRIAPYDWYELPVVLGTIGGAGLVVGPIGLLLIKRRRDPMLVDMPRQGMDVAFLVMLLVTGVTGLALLALRSTPAMGLLLAIHLGVVLGLFLTMPYGKFVHGLYRFAALVRYAKERRGSLQK